MYLLLYFTIGYDILSGVELALIKAIKLKSVSPLMSDTTFHIWRKLCRIETILIAFVFIDTIVDIVMVDGSVRSFTGDPWYVFIHDIGFLTAWLYGLSTALRKYLLNLYKERYEFWEVPLSWKH